MESPAIYADDYKSRGEKAVVLLKGLDVLILGVGHGIIQVTQTLHTRGSWGGGRRTAMVVELQTNVSLHI